MSAPLWHMYRVIITPSRARNRLEKWPKSPYPHDNTPTSPITMWLKFNYYTSMNLNCDLNSILLVESSKMRRQRCRPPSILSLSLYRVTVSRECLFDLLLLFGAKFILLWLNFPCFVDNFFSFNYACQILLLLDIWKFINFENLCRVMLWWQNVALQLLIMHAFVICNIISGCLIYF